MGIRDLKKVSSEDKDLQKVQDNLEVWAKQLSMCPLLDGVMLKNVVLTSGTNIVEHKLNRAPVDCLIFTPNTAATIYKQISAQPSKTLNLVSSANTTVNIWVF